jgi:GrpB-like predicted nucleotidyltransferase (UPF0157 family)
MLTPDQEKWISERSDVKKITVVPYDPRTDRLFDIIKKKVHDILGPEVFVEHDGASGLGISGQDEIDVSIVVEKEKFADYIPKLEKKFGQVKSHYPDRARFEVQEEGKKIDLKIIDVHHPNYTRSKIFLAYLRAHPEDLEKYRILKEKSDGMTVKEYYRTKIEFINDILLKAGEKL